MESRDNDDRGDENGEDGVENGAAACNQPSKKDHLDPKPEITLPNHTLQKSDDAIEK